MDEDAFRRVLDILRRRYPVGNWAEGRNPFDVLISIIMSQNSTDGITERVMEALRSRGPVTPEAILAMDPRDLRRILRPAGLSAQKVPRIRGVARAIQEEHGGSMEAFEAMTTAGARKALMRLPGVGPKTADVWLSLVAGRPTMPVDTHIWRLARRWYLAKGKEYEEVSSRLASLISPAQRWRDHLVLIHFGRDICRARIPLCPICPVYELCDAEEKRPRSNGRARELTRPSPSRRRGRERSLKITPHHS